MDWRQCALILMHYIGYLVVLSVVTTQPCSHEDTLMRNQDCIDDVDCSKDYPYAIRECGDNTECYSTPFRSHCSCKNGFISTTGEISFDTRTDCVDINECDEAELCGPNASCNNTMGSYYCFCNRGFESSGEIYFPALTATFCQDINECDHDNDELCGPNESCHNTVGSYFCSCHQGFGSSGEIDSSDLTQTRCQVSAPSPNPPADSRSHDDSAVGRDPSLSAAPEQPASPAGIFCSLMTNASRLVDELCHKPANGLPIEDIILFTTQLLRDDSPLKNIGQEERLNSASKILQAVEKAAVAIALSSADQGLKDITSKEMDLQLRVIHVNSTLTDDKVRLEAKGNAVDISWRTVIGSKMTGSVAVAFIVYNNMDSILHGARCENKETNDKYKDIRLQSRVISATVGSSASYKFPVATSFILKHKEDLTAGGRLLCAYWSHTTSGSHWSARGCELVGSNDTHTTCQCDHLSSFAILMAFNEKLQDYSHDALSVVMFIGIPISLVCLAVAVGTFVFCSQARNAVTATHTQLCASLFLAELLFIMGIDRTGNQTMCGIIAGCLHYLFLTAFAWMSLESTQLYLMVKNLKNMRVSHSSNVGKYIYPLGYGSPALIVAISAAVYPNGYGSERNCWLQIENGFVWSFLGPVYLIILVNTFLFTMTLYILNEELANRDVKVSKIKDTRMLTFKAIAQVFILGCTWIFGLFHFQEETVVMAYLFTIVNSFQGTFIFIILCVLNPKVRAEYRKWITLICKSRKSLFESESTKVPLSVTSVSLLVSSIATPKPMTSIT
ncbi:adhesion G protein-coupled receptor E3-like isoform X5 [Heterodontus francisci]|uniref:adhesion G protein-coupled receptor E3-like isoform X5 n=1 Tax=Heterodontus francisci TaxID=7792 RepID=UPI00355C2368